MERFRVRACKTVGILQTHRKLQDRIGMVLNDRISIKVKAKWHSNHCGYKPRAQMRCHIMLPHYNPKDHNRNHRLQAPLHNNQANHHLFGSTTRTNPTLLASAAQVNPP